MNDQIEQPRSRVDILGITAAFIGAIIAVVGAAYIANWQVRVAEGPLWPLPGLVLLLWACLGVIGLVTAFLSSRVATASWLQGLWFICGAFIPIILLGAFSISSYVLITWLLFLISSMLLAYTRHPKWLASFGWLVLGVLLNPALVLLIVTLVTPKS